MMSTKNSEVRLQRLMEMLRESEKHQDLVIFLSSVSKCEAARRGLSVQSVAQHLATCDLDRGFLQALADPEHDGVCCYLGEEFSGGFELARAVMLGEGFALPKELLDLHGAYRSWLAWYISRDARVGMSVRPVGRLTTSRPSHRSRK